MMYSKLVPYVLHTDYNQNGPFDPHDQTIVEKYRIKKTYDKKQGNTQQKVVNTIIIINIVFNKSGYIIYFDGEDARTTLMFYDAGINMSRCIAITNERPAYEAINKYAKYGLTAHFGNFYDIIDTLSTDIIQNLDFVWYDGLATVIGAKNTNISPKKDIHKLLNLTDHKFMLAITFAQRANQVRHDYILEMRTNESDSDTEIEDTVQEQQNDAIQERPVKRQLRRSSRNKSVQAQQNVLKKKRGITRIEQKKILKNTFKRRRYTHNKIARSNYRSMYFWVVELTKNV